MRPSIPRLFALAAALFLAGCASSPRHASLPPYETPIARAEFQNVRTTAYTHSEADHKQYGRQSACGTRLQSNKKIHSASCDWSRWPMGTIFRILETNEIYQVDDYGWALAGTNTIDLYKPNKRAMNAWGVRRVNIQILRWGNVDQSLAILRQRTHYAHVKRMVDEINARYAEISAPMPSGDYAVQNARPAMIVHTPRGNGVPLTPFQ